MRFRSSFSGRGLPRLRIFLGSLAVTLVLVCFTTAFLYAGQVQLARRSEEILIERLNQAAVEYLTFIRGGFFQSSELVRAVRTRDISVLGRKFDEFRKGYSGAEILLTQDRREVFRAGDLEEIGPALRGRLGRGGELEVGGAAVLYDDFGRAMPDLRATFWLDLSGALNHLERLSEDSTLSAVSCPGALAVFSGVWLVRSSPTRILLSVFETKAYVGLLVIQGVILFVALLLGVSLFHQRESRYHRVVSLAGVLEEKDPYTMGHSDRVAHFSERIGVELGIGAKSLKRLKLAALAHDLGKIFVPIEDLNNPERLTEEEWQIIRRHPVDSERIFQKLLSNRDVARIIRSHHERWDGGGYPDELAGKGIPLGGAYHRCSGHLRCHDVEKALP